MPFDLKNDLKNHIFGGRTFCCCLPLRLGVLLISIISLLLSGFLGVLCWYEVKVTITMPGTERTAFAIAALVETMLFIASFLGLLGAIVKKQSFVAAYTYFLYFHFLLNCAVAAYLLFMITHAASTDVVKACQEGLHNGQATDQCEGLLSIAKGVYFAVASILLLSEMYTTIIVTRYYRFLRDTKRFDKAERLSRISMAAQKRRYAHVSSDSEAGAGLLPMREFDPYENYDHSPSAPDSAGLYDPAAAEAATVGLRPRSTVSTHTAVQDDEDDVEKGYGYGLDTRERDQKPSTSADDCSHSGEIDRDASTSADVSPPPYTESADAPQPVSKRSPSVTSVPSKA